MGFGAGVFYVLLDFGPLRRTRLVLTDQDLRACLLVKIMRFRVSRSSNSLVFRRHNVLLHRTETLRKSILTVDSRSTICFPDEDVELNPFKSISRSDSWSPFIVHTHSLHPRRCLHSSLRRFDASRCRCCCCVEQEGYFEL